VETEYGRASEAPPDDSTQWGSGLTQEERQLLPVLEHVGDGFAQPGVGLHQSVLELPNEPRLQFFHQRTALGLMELQTILR